MEEIVIIGSGCAGMTAAIYAARAGCNPLVIEGPQSGGLLTTTSEVENFPGFPEGIDGFGLLWNMRQQAEKFGAKVESSIVEKVDFSSSTKKIFLSGGKVVESKKVIIATGAKPRLTGAKNEAQLYGGNGVSTCATCDGAFYRDVPVSIVGGGDTAAEEALFLSKFASKVYLIHRRDALRADKIMAQRVIDNPKITVLWDSIVKEVLPDENGKCKGLVLENVKTKTSSEIECKAMFAAIGHIPNTEIFKGHLPQDENGYIIPEGKSLVETNIENVFVAGDCSDKTFRQAITASAMGAMAAILATRE